MKKRILSIGFGLAMIVAVGILSVHDEAEAAPEIDVTFCKHGSEGKCVPAIGGFACMTGGSDCGGMHSQEL